MRIVSVDECEMMKVRYRQRPGDTLYSMFDEDEDATECGHAASCRASTTALLLAAYIAVILNWNIIYHYTSANTPFYNYYLFDGSVWFHAR